MSKSLSKSYLGQAVWSSVFYHDPTLREIVVLQRMLPASYCFLSLLFVLSHLAAACPFFYLDKMMRTLNSRTQDISKPKCQAKESGMTNVIEIQKDKKHLPAFGGDPQRNSYGAKMLNENILRQQILSCKGGV